MKRFFTTILTIVLLISFDAIASTTGNLSGKVLDEEGNPAVGASVQVVGTPRGAIVKSDGKYYIGGIDAGEWEVKASIVGSEPLIKKIRISAGKTSTLDFSLAADEVMLDEVVVVAEKIIDMEEKGTERVFDQETVKSIATNNVNALATLTAGVASGGSGFQVRGSRSDQTQIRVDGMDVSDQFVGGYGSVGNTYYPGVSQFALQEMSVKTGGFGAQYGSATGGVVNMQVNAGNTQRYRGTLNYRTDLDFLWGRGPSDLEVFREDGGELNIRNFGEGYQLQGPNQHQVDMALDGPIPFTKLSTFSLSNRTQYDEFIANSYEIRDPDGNNLGQLPHNSVWVRNITPRFNFILSDRVRMLVGGSWGRTNRQNSSWGWLYADAPARFITYDAMGLATDTNIVNLTEREYKQGGSDWQQVNAFARIQHNITNTTFYEINVRYNVQHDYSGRLASHSEYGTPGYFTGWEFLEPVDQFNLIDSNYVGQSDPRKRDSLNRPNLQHDYYEPHLISNLAVVDGKRTGLTPVENPFSGYVEGVTFAGNQSLYNAYGVNNSFIRHGSGGYAFRYNNYIQVDGTLNSRIETNEFIHQLTTGFEFRLNEMHRHSVGSPAVSGSIGKDIYSDLWDDIYTIDPAYQDIALAPKRPMNFNFFAQDQISYGGFQFTPGVRVDGFYANEKHRLAENSALFIPLARLEGTNDGINYDNPELFADTDLKLFFSPRLNVNYPITERSKLNLNYGVYYKIAPLQPMFDFFNYNAVVNLGRIGNPNMEPERTNMYEVGYDYAITQDMAFNVQAYYKDVFNELGVVGVRTTPEPYFQTDVVEYGTYRGLEAEIRKRASDNYSFFINYTLSQALGTADNINTNVGVPPDRSIPGITIFPYPLAPYPLGRDIRHQVKMNFALFFNRGEGPSLGGLKILQNTRLAITYNYRTGLPFTVTDLNGQQLSEINAERLPTFWNANLVLTREVDLASIFGSSMAGKSVIFKLDVFNFLNRTPIVSWFTDSKDPDYNARLLQSFRIGQIRDIDFYSEAQQENPDSFAPDQYDDFGNRMYDIRADFDENGIVTQEEQYQGYLNYFQDQLRFKPNYQTPRTVFFNIQFNF